MNLAQILSATAVTLALIGVVAALAWHGTITGGETITFLSGLGGIGIGAGAVHVGVKSGARAARGTE